MFSQSLLNNQLRYLNSNGNYNQQDNICFKTQLNIISDKVIQQKNTLNKNATDDIFDVFYNISKVKLKQEQDIEQQKPPQAFTVNNGEIIEHGVVLNRNKFYYNNGICKEDGELFGLQYQQLWKGLKRQVANSVNWFQIYKQHSQPQTITFEHQEPIQNQEPHQCDIYQKNVQNTREIDYYIKQLNNLNNQQPQHDTINVIQTTIDQYLNAHEYGLTEQYVKKQNITPSLKYYVQKSKQAIPPYILKQINHNQQGKSNQSQNDPKVECVKEILQKEEKLLCGIKYTPNYNVECLNGFKFQNSLEYQKTLELCPSLVHFIVCLLAHQETDALLGDQELLYGQIDKSQLFKQRQSMSVLHVLIALKEHFPGALNLIPANVSPLEAVVTALNVLMSPGGFTLRNSIFDRRGGDEMEIQMNTNLFKESDLSLQQKKKILSMKLESAYVEDREAYFVQLRELKDRSTTKSFPSIYTVQKQQTKQQTKMTSYTVSAMQQQQAALLRSIQQAKSAASSNIKSNLTSNIKIPQLIPPNIPQPTVKSIEAQQKNKDQAFQALSQVKTTQWMELLDDNVISNIISNSKTAKQLGQVQFLVDKVSQNNPNISVYISQNQLVIIENDGRKQQLYPLDFNYEDLASLQVSNLFQPKVQKTEAQEQADETITQTNVQFQAKKVSEPQTVEDQLLQSESIDMRILSLVSPLLGEYELKTSETLQNIVEPNQKHQIPLYFGVDASLICKVASLVNVLLTIASEEYKIVLSGEQMQEATGESVESLRRLAALQQSKARVALTISHLSSYEIGIFRAQERLRFNLFGGSYFVYCISGRCSLVAAPTRMIDGRQKGGNGEDELDRDVPAAATRAQLFQEAAARLPAHFGTREDICALLAASQYIDKTDTRFVPRVSQTLERLKAQNHIQHSGKVWIFKPQRFLIRPTEYIAWPANMAEAYGITVTTKASTGNIIQEGTG